MLLTFKKLTEDYCGQGLLNKEALKRMRNWTTSTWVLDQTWEFAFDCCAFCNEKIGAEIKKGHTTWEDDGRDWITVVSASVREAAAEWRDHGRNPRPGSTDKAPTVVGDYIEACLRVRVENLFRKDRRFKDKLYAAMSRCGMTRIMAMEVFDDMVTRIRPQPGDEYTDEYLNGVVMNFAHPKPQASSGAEQHPGGDLFV